MPPQKNSGNRGSKKEAAVTTKNNRFVNMVLDDLRKEGHVDDIYISRILRKMGNGRMEAFYIDKDGRPQIRQTLIRGSFRGKGKRGAWIDIGSIVVMADSGIKGSGEFEIVAVLSHDQIRDLRKEMDIDPRVLAIDNVDTEALKKSTSAAIGDEYEFADDDAPKDDAEEDIIKQEERNKARAKPELDHVDDDNASVDIDAI